MAQHVIEEMPVSMRGDSVHLVVGGHEAGGMGFLNRRLKRFEEIFANHALRVVAGADIGSRLGLTMHGEMLRRRHDVRFVDGRSVSLKSLDGGDADAGGQVGIFAIGFFGASPAWITGQIEYRS